MRRMVEINFDTIANPAVAKFEFQGQWVELETHFIGDDSRLAESIILSADDDPIDFILSSDHKNLAALSALPTRNRIYRGKVLGRLVEVLGLDIVKIKDLLARQANFPSNLAFSIGLIEGLIDQMRQLRATQSTLEGFARQWVQEALGDPLIHEPKNVRCAFIVHPLTIAYLAHLPFLSGLKKAPLALKRVLEKSIVEAPCLKIGEVANVQSRDNGPTVHCDIYSVWATPRQFSKMDPQKAYRILTETVAKAKARGAVLCGLGAFTKVVGDSGVSVHKMSDLPITTGNSLSASATLWSARQMVERMGLIQRNEQGRWQGKAMVIGATGSIGKCCAKLLAHGVERLVLVAPNQNKLTTLQREIQQSDKNVEVIVTCDANTEIADTDVVITATSVYEGELFDFSRLPPGALVVECSRPLNISKNVAASRRDVLVGKSGEVILPGDQMHLTCDIGLPKGVVYACLAETILLTLEGIHEPFSLSRDIPESRVRQIYRLAQKHGVKLAPIESVEGPVTDTMVEHVIDSAKSYRSKRRRPPAKKASSVGSNPRAINYG